jgi:Tol biopolymer transport system component
VKKLIESAGPNGNPKWSPDGKKIVFTTFNGNPFFSYTNRYVAVVPADGGQLRLVPHEFAEDANLIGWRPDGIYFGAQRNTAAHVFRADAATKVVRRITGPDAFLARARHSPRTTAPCPAPRGA